MSKKTPSESKGARFCRNVRAIAGAWGCDVLKQRVRRYDQLAPVRAAVLRPDFPKKTKSGWPCAEVVAWATQHVQLSKDKRTFTLVENQPPPPDPAQPGVVAEGDLFLKLTPEELAAQQKRRLDYFEDIHLHPGERLAPSGLSFLRLSGRERDDLRASRPWLFQNAPVESPAAVDGGDEFTGGVEAVAAYIQMKFPGVICNKTDISRWQHMKFLPDGCTEQFPPSHDSGRNSKRKIDAWIVKYKKPSGTEQNLPGVDNTDYEREQKKLNFIRAQEEFKVWQQGNSNKFMETTSVEGFIDGFGTWIGMQQDKLIEDLNGVRKLVAAAVQAVFKATPEQLAMLDTRLVPKLAAANDAMKAAVENQGDDLFKQLVADRQEAIKNALAN